MDGFPCVPFMTTNKTVTVSSLTRLLYMQILNCHQSQTRQAMYLQHDIGAPTCNHCCRGKSITTTYSECVFESLSIQHKLHVCHIVIWGLPDPTYYHTCYLIKSTIFKKMLLNIKCVFWFCLPLLSETFLILRNERDVIVNVQRSSHKVPTILVRF